MSGDTQNRLGGVRLLTGLDEVEMRNIERRCRWRRYASGEQIVDKDSDDRDVYFVSEGSVQIVNYSLTGREIALARVNAGGYFGELSAIDGEPRSASVVAVANCLLGSLAPSLFIDLLARHPDLAVHVLNRLASIIRSCDERIMDLSTLGAVQRVYLQVLRLAEESPANPDQWVIRQMPTHKTIAAMASTTRETVARSVSVLVGSQIIERKGRVVFIRERGKLEKLAGALDVDGPPGLSR